MYSRASKRFFTTLTLTNVNHVPSPFQGDVTTIIAQRQKHFSPIYRQHYKSPLVIVQGHLQYLYDHKGNRYLDLQANQGQVILGHSHPQIVKIIQDQSAKLIHTSSIYMGENHGQLSKRLVSELGEGFKQVYLCNSIAEANDFAIMISRIHVKEHELFSYRHAFHGLVGYARSATNLGHWSTTNFQKVEFERLPWPKHKENALDYIQEAKQILSSTSSGKPGVLIYECLQTLSGVHLPPKRYFEVISKMVREMGGVMLCDESNTGLGRIGNEYWGHKWRNHRPDVVTLGNSLGNGLPLSAVVTRQEISSAMKHVFFNTFSAGHMQCKISLAVLDIIKRDNLAQNADNIGDYLLKKLKKLKIKHPCISQVRGKGLLIGIDVIDSAGKPCKATAQQLMQLLRERQLLFGRSGPEGSTLTMRPPLVITKADAKYLLEAFEDALLHLK